MTVLTFYLYHINETKYRIKIPINISLISIESHLLNNRLKVNPMLDVGQPFSTSEFP